MAPHTINTTVAGRQLGKKIICWTPANISSLITSATNNSHRVQMFAAQFPEDSCGWCVLLTANQLLDTRDICCSPYWPATPTTNDSVNISTYRQHQYQHRLFWWVGQGLICTKLCMLANLFRKRRQLQFFSTRNAFITILSSRLILPIKMHKRGYYSTVLFL